MKITGLHTLKPHTFSRQIAFIILLAALSIGAFILFYQRWAIEFDKQTHSTHKQTIIQTVTVAKEAIEPVITDFSEGKISRDEALSLIRTIVRNMTYNDQYGKNYIFMSAYNGTMLVQPYEPEMEMTDQSGLRDDKGKYIVRELISAAKKYPEGSFVSYYYHIPGIYKNQEKLAYIVGIPELECYIGTGMYMQQAVLEQHKILDKAEVWSAVLIVFLVCLSFTAVVIIVRNNRRRALEKETLYRTESALKISETQYSELVENVRSIVLRWDMHGYIKYINEFGEELFGYSHGELNGKNVLDTIVPSEETTGRDLKDMIKQIISAPEAFATNINENIAKDGRRFWILWKNRPFYSDNGELREIMSIGSDITELRTAELAVRESEETLRLIIENSGDGILFTAQDGGILSANKEACHILERTEEEIIRVGRRGIIDTNDPRLPAALEEREKTGKFTGELNMLKKDGTPFPCEISSIIFSDSQGHLRTSTFIHDITKRKKMEDTLHKSEEKYRSLVDNANETILVIQNGQVRFFNNKLYELTNGYTLMDFEGKQFTDFIHPDDREMVLNNYHRRIRGETLPSRYEFRIIAKDGVIKWVEISVVMIIWEGKPSTLNFLIDITERKLAEKALRKSENLLAAGAGAAHLGSWEFDIEKRESTVSDEWQRIHGCYLKTVPLNDLTSLLHPDDKERVMTALAESFSSVEPFEIEHKIIRMDNGEVRYVRVYGEKVFNSEGAPVKMYLASLDITGQKLTEEALEKSETHLQRIATVLKDTFYSVEGESREFSYLSPSFEKLLGYTEEDIRAMGGREAFLNQVMTEGEFTRQKQFFLGEDSGIKETGFSEWSSWWKRKDGTMVYIEDHFMKIYENGQFKNSYGVLRDVTARKLAEEALKESEAMQRSILRATPVGIGLAINRVMLEMNDSFCEITGYPREELIGQNTRMLYPTIEHYEHVGTFLYAEAGEKGVGVTETQFKTKDGRIIDIIINLNQLDESDLSKGVIFSILDITSRKQAEEALRESEERLRAFIDNAESIFWIKDLEGRFLIVNKYCERILGLSQEQMIGHTVYEIHPQNLAEDYTKNDHLSLESGKPMEFEEITIQHDGPHVYQSVKIPLRDSTGKIYALSAICTDVTDRRKAGEALRETEEIFRQFMEHSPIYVFFKDDNIRSLRLSRNYEKMLGRPLEDLLNKNMFELFPSDLAKSMVADDMLILKEGRQITVDEEMNGHYYTTIKFPIIIEDKPVYLAGYTIDITDRKLAEEKIINQMEFLSTLIDTIPNPIYYKDLNEVYIGTNRAFLEFLGRPSEEVIGKTVSDIVSTDMAEKFHQKDQDLFANPGNQSFEWIVTAHDGSKKIMLISRATFRDSAGNVAGIIGIMLDISDRKKMEEERLDLERRLLHSQKLESLGVLAGGIAHDFNNILMAILGNLDLALIDIPPDSSAKPFIEEAVTASKRAADLTQQMLAYSGKGHFVISEIDLTALVEENASIFRASLLRTVTLNLRLEKNLPGIRADVGQVQQVVMNLIANASDAIGDKPGVTTISTGVMDCDEEYLSKSRVDEKPSPGRFVFIEVSDTGIGMSNETIQRLFDPFFTTKFTGRGLGMSAVLGILRGHGGAIMVYSEPGQGTTIKALFPALEGIPSERQVEITEPEFGLLTPGEDAHNHLVLVVDDEEGVRSFCQKALGIFGYRTLSAADGMEAVAVYRSHSAEIDCVIMDLTMPKMDGAETIEALWKINPGLKIILSSGFSEQEATRRFVDKDLTGFIQKPYNLRRLRDTLEKAFGE